jgi:hypothetical protein
MNKHNPVMLNKSFVWFTLVKLFSMFSKIVRSNLILFGKKPNTNVPAMFIPGFTPDKLT